MGLEDAEEIGRGGFAVVYRCRQVALDRTVAVKVLTTPLDEDNLARFVREQRAMGRLTGHPNIVTVLEVGSTASGRPYLVMPYHARDSLDAWIRQHGPLTAQKALWVGTKIAGALAGAHRLGIVHRDVKPGNILLTDFGEPALTDFGIAHIVDGFRTGEGTLTGSPAFTAPEVLEGGTPSPSADVYGLGSTLFCALTGHAPFERRSGENVMTQFLRITTEPIPELEEEGIDGDVSQLVSTAMDRNPERRPSAVELEKTMRGLLERHGLPMNDIALRDEGDASRREQTRSDSAPPAATMAAGRTVGGNLPIELSSFVGRRSEVSEVKNLLSTSRLVTLAGIGGVGKTRLALRVAWQVRRDFSDGVWLVELADVPDPAILIDVVAGALGLRHDSSEPLLDVLIRYLRSREMLLVLDNCEQMVEPVARLVEIILRTCPDLRIIATSRELLNIGGETVLRVLPLSVPAPEPSLAGLPRFDAVALFTDRAATVVRGFELDEDNKASVARICGRLDGLPLAIELAAAQMRTMSPQQIVQRLDDRYALLRHSSRTAPTRQQTLKWCIDWSYELCTPAEQQLWARLSVFAGGVELDAVEHICAAGATGSEPDCADVGVLDVLSALIDKSIVIREESGTAVRFRMLDTLRDYGRERLRSTGDYEDVRRRHREWYQQLTAAAEAGWISAYQPDWIARIEREQLNLREALESFLAEDTAEATEAAMRIANALYEFWIFRGLLSEGRAWFDRILTRPFAPFSPARITAICLDAQLATSQADFQAAAALLEEGHALAERNPIVTVEAQLAHADAVLAVLSGDSSRASALFESAVEMLGADDSLILRVSALTMSGWSYEVHGDMAGASARYREALAITEQRGESSYRSIALRGLGITAWQAGDSVRARELLQDALRVNLRLNGPVIAAFTFEALAWVPDPKADPDRSAVLMGAAKGIMPTGSDITTVFPNMSRFHDDCVQRAQQSLGTRRFDAAIRRGEAMGMDVAVAYALGETDSAAAAETSRLTRRERQVADLVAQGLSNKQIAAKLVISQRTAQGHVEHILAKLGFNSRAQIAAWAVDESRDSDGS